jgi:hypothetical protein
MPVNYIRYFYLAVALILGGVSTIIKLQCNRNKNASVEKVQSAISNYGTFETFNVGRSISYLSEDEMRSFMYANGFKDLNNFRLGILRRIYLAHGYAPMYREMALNTGLDESIIFSLHIFESTINGIETDLFAEHKNPGGIKYRGRGYKVLWFDDCRNDSGLSIPCEFEGLNTYQDMLDAWTEVLNARRYDNCKTLSDIQSTCKCLQQAGYHTANSYKQRYRLAEQYYILQNHFPVP